MPVFLSYLFCGLFPFYSLSTLSSPLQSARTPPTLSVPTDARFSSPSTPPSQRSSHSHSVPPETYTSGTQYSPSPSQQHFHRPSNLPSESARTTSPSASHPSFTILHTQHKAGRAGGSRGLELTAPCSTATTCASSRAFNQLLARRARSLRAAESGAQTPSFEFHPSVQREKSIPWNCGSACSAATGLPVSHGNAEHSCSSGSTSIPSAAACGANPRSVVCSVRRSGEDTRRLISGLSGKREGRLRHWDSPRAVSEVSGRWCRRSMLCSASPWRTSVRSLGVTVEVC